VKEEVVADGVVEGMFANSFSHLSIRIQYPSESDYSFSGYKEHVSLFKNVVKYLFDAGVIHFSAAGEFFFPGKEVEFWNEVQYQMSKVVHLMNSVDKEFWAQVQEDLKEAAHV
jgi:hypothetical protein